MKVLIIARMHSTMEWEWKKGGTLGVLRGRMFNKLSYRKVTMTFTCTFTFTFHNSDSWGFSKLKVDLDVITTIFVK